MVKCMAEEIGNWSKSQDPKLSNTSKYVAEEETSEGHG